MFASFEVDFDQGFLNLSLSNKYSGQLFCSNLFVSISFIVPLFFFPKRSRCYMLLLYWTSKDWLHLIHGLEKCLLCDFQFLFLYSFSTLPPFSLIVFLQGSLRSLLSVQSFRTFQHKSFIIQHSFSLYRTFWLCFKRSLVSQQKTVPPKQ